MTKTRSLIIDPLRKRQDSLRRSLQRLSNQQFVLVKKRSTTAKAFAPRVEIESVASVRKTNFIFQMREEFTDIDTNPHLYRFSYCLYSKSPGDDPLFRYECHPDLEDADPTASPGARVAKQYELHPHFHPFKSPVYPISHLHYPFLRSERMTVVFSLIAWIEIDLVKRYYDSGRVA